MDYAIRISGLYSPPAVAFTTEQYRPGVTVANEGNFANSASGSLRIYDKASGLLIKTTSIYSGPIPAGDSRVAQSDSYWLPPYTGEFFAIAHLDATNCKADMPPAFFTVSSLPPPPPPSVPAHAEQHEEGAVDEINVSDLSGVLLENQHPADHASNHQLSGPDQINVSGLSGVLAQAQTPAAHGATKHDQTVEATANKGEANGYAPLDEGGFLPRPNLTPLTMAILSADSGAYPPDSATDAMKLAVAVSMIPGTTDRGLWMASVIAKFSSADVALPAGLQIGIGPNGHESWGQIVPTFCPGSGIETPCWAKVTAVVDPEVQNYITIMAGPTAPGTLSFQVLFVEAYVA